MYCIRRETFHAGSCSGKLLQQVCLLVIAKGYLKLALRISATMMRRGHIRETAQVSRYLVAAGQTDFKQCLTGHHPAWSLTSIYCKIKFPCQSLPMTCLLQQRTLIETYAATTTQQSSHHRPITWQIELQDLCLNKVLGDTHAATTVAKPLNIAHKTSHKVAAAYKQEDRCKGVALHALAAWLTAAL